MSFPEESTSVIQIVTPNVDGGVLDYAHCLQSSLGRDAEVYRLGFDSKHGWNPADKHVVLQYSGYGFHRRGAPLWLLREVMRRRKEMRSFGVYFHELFAPVGLPWQSSFYLAPIQRLICRRLLREADFWLTNRAGTAKWLQTHSQSRRSAVLGTFSNVGEPLDASSQRDRIVAVFGGALLRQSLYLKANEILEWATSKGYVVHDLGPSIEDEATQRQLELHRVVQHGRLPAGQVSAMLLRAEFGLLAYSLGEIAKSGVFAAYAAHGVCPVVSATLHAPTDGLTPGVTYLPSQDISKLERERLQTVSRSIGQSAWDWYQSHRIAMHADRLTEFIAEHV